MSERNLAEYVKDLREFVGNKFAGAEPEGSPEVPGEVSTGKTYSPETDEEMAGRYLENHPSLLADALFLGKDLVTRHKGVLAVGFGIAVAGVGIKILYDHKEGLKGRLAESLDIVLKRYNAKPPSS